jgi:hypothetical protein
MCSEAAVQGNNSPSATRSCDQGSRAQAHPPPVVWIGEALPAPKQPKLPSREILDHSRRFIPNTVRPFPSSDSSRAITQLHHSVCPCVPAKLHKLRVHPPIYLALAVLTTHPPNGAPKQSTSVAHCQQPIAEPAVAQFPGTSVSLFAPVTLPGSKPFDKHWRSTGHRVI